MLETAGPTLQARPEPVRHESFADFEIELAETGAGRGIALVLDGSGECRANPRCRYMARVLRERGLDTALFDFCGTGDGPPPHRTLTKAVEWVKESLPETPVGLLGVERGAVAAIGAAFFGSVDALVLHGSLEGSLDPDFSRLAVPTLMIVGSRDTDAIKSARTALERMVGGAKRLEIVPGTNGRFDEPGTLAAASLHAAHWFGRAFSRVAFASVR
jgi:alpha/beta superfamily hydrolase